MRDKNFPGVSKHRGAGWAHDARASDMKRPRRSRLLPRHLGLEAILEHPPLQIRVPLSEALEAPYVLGIGFDQYRERNGLWKALGGVKGRLGQEQAGRGLWACCRLGGRAARQRQEQQCGSQACLVHIRVQSW